MARVLITGSSAGLGLMVGQHLVDLGHRVVLHARDTRRAAETEAQCPGAEAVLIADTSTIAATSGLARQADDIGRFDAVLHNVGVGYREPRAILTEDGLPHVFAVNVLSVYVLTALMRRPDRLIFMGSGTHPDAQPRLDDLTWSARPWDGYHAYAESKLYNIMMAFALARHWPDVRSNALEPGWVSTRMGGEKATGRMDLAHLTQAWLAVGEGEGPEGSGEYYYHQRPKPVHPAARDTALQDELLARCADLSGIRLDLGN